jgi:hypothetical protein
MKSSSSADGRKNAEKPPGPLEIDSLASQTADGDGLITMDVKAFDSFDIRRRIRDKTSLQSPTGGQ